MGAEKAFAWLVARREAGRRGGQSKKSSNLTEANAKQNEAHAKQTPSKTKPLTPTLVLTPTPTLAPTQEFLTGDTKNLKQEDLSEPARSVPEEPAPAPKPHVLAELWNSHCGELPKVRGPLGKTRKRAADARWKEKPDEAYWAQVIREIQLSDFCNGKGRTGWRADFDFLVKPETGSRVLEGKYANRVQDAVGGFRTHQDRRSEQNLTLLQTIEKEGAF